MASPVPALPSFRQPRHSARRRIAIALCASAAAHLWLLAAGGGAARVAGPASSGPHAIHARLALPRGAQAPAAGVAPDRGADHEAGVLSAPVPPGVKERTPRQPGAAPVGQVQSATTDARTDAAARSGSSAGDSRWYTALELDTFPRAEAALDLALDDRVRAGAGDRRLLLWLRIDETGRVVEVSPGAPGMPARALESARAALGSVRFVPGSKDERAVKSRLLLSVSVSPRAPGPAGVRQGEGRDPGRDAGSRGSEADDGS